MFSGIIEARAPLIARAGSGAFRRLKVGKPAAWDSLGIGSSVAVNGVCLTVTDEEGEAFFADLSYETLARTGLGDEACGSGLNLERPVALGQGLHGHLVTGHVDCRGRVVRVERREAGREIWIEPDRENPLEFLVEKGSVAVNGASLTVGALRGDSFQLVLIPHTLDLTGFALLRPGEGVNLEFDLLAKYFRKWYLQDREGGYKTSAIHYL